MSRVSRHKKHKKNWKRIEVFGEFLVFGILFGTIEDVVAVKIVSDAPITIVTIGIIILIAIPFAVLGELVADRINFVRLFQKMFSKS